MKTPISNAASYAQIGEFWDTHDLADHWAETQPAEFQVQIRSGKTYYAVERSLADRVRDLAMERGVSAETLLNLWIQEKLGVG